MSELRNIPVPMPPEMIAAIDQIVEQEHGFSRAAVIRRIVASYLDTLDKERVHDSSSQSA